MQPGGGERVAQVLAPSRAFRHHQGASPEVAEKAPEGFEGLAGLGLRRHAGRDAGGVGDESAAAFLLETPDPDLGACVQRREGLVDGQEQLRGIEQGALPVVPAALVALRHVVPEALRRLVHFLAEHHQGVVRQILEQGGAALEEERQVVLDAGRAPPPADLAVRGAGVGIAFEARPPRAAETLDGSLRQGKLARREEAHPAEPARGSLGLRVEGPEAVHLVVQEIDAQRPGRSAGEEVDERSADRELPVIHDLAHAAVAEALQPAAHRREVEALALGEQEAAAMQELGRRHPSHQGARGHDQDAASPLRQAVQRGQAFGDEVLVGREHVVGQGLPVGKVQERGPRPDRGRNPARPQGGGRRRCPALPRAPVRGGGGRPRRSPGPGSRRRGGPTGRAAPERAAGPARRGSGFGSRSTPRRGRPGAGGRAFYVNAGAGHGRGAPGRRPCPGVHSKGLPALQVLPGSPGDGDGGARGGDRRGARHAHRVGVRVCAGAGSSRSAGAGQPEEAR